MMFACQIKWFWPAVEKGKFRKTLRGDTYILQLDTRLTHIEWIADHVSFMFKGVWFHNKEAGFVVVGGPLNVIGHEPLGSLDARQEFGSSLWIVDVDFHGSILSIASLNVEAGHG